MDQVAFLLCAEGAIMGALCGLCLHDACDSEDNERKTINLEDLEMRRDSCSSLSEEEEERRDTPPPYHFHPIAHNQSILSPMQYPVAIDYSHLLEQRPQPSAPVYYYNK